MKLSKAAEIAQQLVDRLATITIANGCASDLGLHIFRGRISHDGSVMPMIVLAELEDAVLDAASHNVDVSLDQKYTIEAHVQCDADNPNDAAHQAIADMKKALFKDITPRSLSVLAGKARAMRYLGRTINPRPDGAAFVSASISVMVTYTENLANP